jgi:hypothetical protein
MTVRKLLDASQYGVEYLTESAGELVHQRVFYVSEAIDAIKRIDPQDCWTPDKSLKLVASIPVELFEHWQTVHGVNLMEKDSLPFLKKLLNDPDNKFVRTDGGSRL